MKRVVLLVTGETELALHQSLKQIFPNVEFSVYKRDGFTSAALPSMPILKEGTTYLEKLAEFLVAEVEPGRRDQKAPDVVVLVDDLELCNVAQPQRAIEHVRRAVQAHVAAHKWPGDVSPNHVLERLRERCSFHLFCPMIEAYFFAESAALERAGANRPSLFDATAVDAEQFYVDDPDFTTPENRLNQKSLPRWATSDREKHPKRYLQFLCDPSGTSPRPYFEVDKGPGRRSGQAALRHLDWSKVLATKQHVQFVRSLIHDIADALDERDVKSQFPGATHPLTWPPPANNVLRNV